MELKLRKFGVKGDVSNKVDVSNEVDISNKVDE